MALKMMLSDLFDHAIISIISELNNTVVLLYDLPNKMSKHIFFYLYSVTMPLDKFSRAESSSQKTSNPHVPQIFTSDGNIDLEI